MMDNVSSDKKSLKERLKSLVVGILIVPVIIFLLITEAIVHNWVRSILLTVLVTIIMIISGMIIALPIKKLIKKYGREVARIKEGDFTLLEELEQYKSNKAFAALTEVLGEVLGEFKGLIDSTFYMMQSIVGSSKKVHKVADETVTAMEAICDTLQDIAVGATKQASQSQSCQAMMEALSTEIESTNKSCKSMLEATQRITVLSDEGSQSLSVLRNKTGETADSIESISVAIKNLNEKLKHIATFVDSIENIASQTNLLALNAAIEAARAGEAGRGFGVVAEEIRTLADQSRQSTDEIKNLVEGIYAEADEATRVMQLVNRATEEEERAVAQTDTAFKEITTGIQFIIEKIDTAAVSITKVNHDKEGVVSAIEAISAVTQTTAAYTEEVASTAQTQMTVMEELKTSANELNEQVLTIDKKLAKYKR
ncbi:hypothetical protein CS063_03510 [Sporanaerobium hydrogeniformans]|uniref:Uncharacterized protein n=1 Tax=Sporanaerobium hydrogeniformans TaxID=3072179 RepID=A0AC61DED9_9FIRM|nr:methyl-accepting chemotaxis protein [Sporanaerobium hydrogeniformans]PHV71644.1 hypothetical protein CS063_03510 [Sporanaerobium hydrogeniformans]